ncbi:glycosyltransferase family 4 protein [Anaerobaca lacustris]|uniref:Glycosyltransferase family 4 protein n=1 Tax=Anaerobaca lacustris TaxID=3044600 RepID=A0AAW6TTP0_9BACT|nr:glycosyltransferase family 4 protein [Sedimentisphaerales bacterium M17dextr]
MDIRDKRIAILAPVAWRTPPRAYGAWETVASNVTEGLVARGFRNVTLFATKDSVTKARLVGFVERGYEEDKTQVPPVSTCLHISKALERADEFDLIHSHFDYLPLTYARLIRTPMLTTIHGFSEPDILRVYREYKDTHYVSISDADRDPELPYVATVYNGIDLSNLTFRQQPGEALVFLGRIHPDKGLHLAIETAKKADMPLLVAGIVQDRAYFDHCARHFDGTRIRYVGPVDPVQRDELLKEARALLHLNTIPERFGLVMAEAMAAGVPVVAMDLGSCREVIEDGRTGYLVHNVEEAVEAVRRIDRIDRRQCRQRVEANFTIDRMAARYEDVYAEIFRREAEKH